MDLPHVFLLCTFAIEFLEYFSCRFGCTGVCSALRRQYMRVHSFRELKTSIKESFICSTTELLFRIAL